jgi:hypothetical protein
MDGESHIVYLSGKDECESMLAALCKALGHVAYPVKSDLAAAMKAGK